MPFHSEPDRRVSAREGLSGRSVETRSGHAENRSDAAGRAGPPDAVRLHQLALRRVLPVAEGRRPVRRRSSRRGRVPHGRGARPPRQHVVVHRRPVLAGARVRGLPRAPGGRAGGVPARASPPAARARDGGAAVLARHERVRGRRRRRPRQRGGHRAARVALRGRGRDRARRQQRARPDRGHRPDGVLRLLPAAPADAARHPRGDRRLAVAGGALAPGPDRRRHARRRPVGRPAAPAGRAGHEDRAAPQGPDAGDRRRDAVRGRQAQRPDALLLLQLARLRPLPHAGCCRSCRRSPTAIYSRDVSQYDERIRAFRLK